ncbi:MAG: ABC transporter permease [Burkholderiaceae bacterium]|nr:MAG: ABC transporter permease [Burkholderiaceae bacterium]
MNIWTIAVFEFKRYFKWKQEIISLCLMLLGFGFSMAWPVLKSVLDKDYQVAVLVEGAMPKLDGYQFTQLKPEGKTDVLKNLGESWHAVIDSENGKLTLTVKEKASWQGKLKNELQTWQQQRLIAGLPLDAAQRKSITDLPEIVIHTLKADNKDQNDRGRDLISGALLFLLIMGIFSGFGYLFTGITSEKQNRVTEQLLTLITPSQWIQGKILGISLFCMKTMITYGILFFLLIKAVAAFSGKAEVNLPITVFEIFSATLFVTLGLLLVNSFMAAFAATIDDPNHSSRSILMFLPALPVGLAYSGVDNAEGMMMQVLSIFPLTSFAAMPLRMAHTEVALWQWALSLTLLIACLWWFKSAATRVFTLGIRMYGKEPTWSQMFEAFMFPSKMT